MARSLGCLALLLLAAPAAGADFPVKIAAARVGLPAAGTERDDSGQPVHVSRFACWAPVYVDLELAAPVAEPAELVIETPDPDEIRTTLAVPLDLAAGGGVATLGYVRPAGVGEVTVTVRTKAGKVLSEPFRVRSVRPRDPRAYVVLAVGGPLPGFELPKPTVGTADPNDTLRGGRVEPTVIADVNHLPDQWIGYETADLVVLNTGAGEFLRRLFGDAAPAADKAKRAALLEWVRRGGRLVVPVGGNAALVSQLPALQELLPFEVKGARQSGPLGVVWLSREAATVTGALGRKGETFPVATLAPKAARPARVLIPPPSRLVEGSEILAAQAAFGLGKVTVVAFDLDRVPFAEMEKRPEFWDWVLREGGAARASVGSEGKPRAGTTGPTEEEDELAIALRTHADTFDGVPVVSFGWIALLIVLYLLLVGPVEYYFLKRVLGRLELTWVTFPVIVLTVSLAAYFTAYAIKGRELKVNKIDVVDIDPATGRVYGTTWFTIFSPRIETYTLGVTPNEGWGTTTPGTAVSWLGAPRGGRASLMRRGYRYHSGDGSVADGLENVPVQVWSTKSFVANWSGAFEPAAAVESRLEHPAGDRSAVIGTFVSRLPIPVLSDCVVFYAGQAYPLPGGTIRPGEEVRLVLVGGVAAGQWLQKESGLESVLLRVPAYAARPGAPRAVGGQPGSQAVAGPLPFWGMLFHEKALGAGEGVIPRNASLRRLDQSWRLDPENRNEVILVGRVAPPVGPAEEALAGPDSPSRLWLKAIPGTVARTPIPGTGRQETWVRVYLPVR